MTVYARQINPLHQTSPFDSFDYFPENIAIFGNDDCVEIVPETVKKIRYVLECGELAEFLYYDRSRKCFWKNITECICDYLPPQRGRYSTKAIHDLKYLLLQFSGYYVTRSSSDDILASVLSIVTGNEWEHCEIRGCVQREWNNVFYVANEVTPDHIERLESEYFNTGTEWEIHMCDTKVEDADDIAGYCMYCYGWHEDDIRAEIAAEEGCKPEEVVLFPYN